MQVMSEASKYKSLNNKQDLISLIRDKAELRNCNMKKYTNAILNEKSKAQLFMIFSKIDYNFTVSQS